MKVLFICSANKDRSRTAADFFSLNCPQHQFASAGTNQRLCRQEKTTFLQKEHLEWADRIYVMEEKHLHFIQSTANTTKEIIVLNITDNFGYYQKELLQILEEKVNL